MLAILLMLFAFQPAPPPGKALFDRRCGGCHALDRDEEGPRLGGVFGRKAGSVALFGYSDALKQSKIVWDAETLDRWLRGPSQFIPGVEMDFHVEDSSERREIIAYLRQSSGR